MQHACRFEADNIILLHDQQPHVDYLPTKVQSPLQGLHHCHDAHAVRSLQYAVRQVGTDTDLQTIKLVNWDR